MINIFRPALLASALLLAAAPAFAQAGASGSSSGGVAPSTQRPTAAVPATPAAPHGQVTQRPAQSGGTQSGGTQGDAMRSGAAPTRPAQPSGNAATTPTPTAPRTN